MYKVLHVEDDEDIRAIVDIALSFADDFELKQSSDGPSALKEAETFRPDLLLLDYMMPEMTGSEVYTAISAMPGMDNVKAIYVTAKVGEGFAEGLLSEGALKVITKPFNPMTLPAQLREALSEEDEQVTPSVRYLNG
ncbi:response regulator [Roseovarius sp. PS-C2]|uniref:response regulator n=1 Tax=Roseovarius sp. PS-C2 TaxID=2820814 RepID=UPI001C0E6081|nr:response regulator [Roseovarius sp. PS-C2]MBU3259985.1 response regulator [Roseovarius sp. PS-C2]